MMKEDLPGKTLLGSGWGPHQARGILDESTKVDFPEVRKDASSEGSIQAQAAAVTLVSPITRLWCSASGMLAMGNSPISRVRESGQQSEGSNDMAGQRISSWM